MGEQPSRPRHARAIQAPPTRRRSLDQAGPAPVRAAVIVLSVLVLVVGAMVWFTVGRAAGSLNSGGDFALGGTEDGATDILLVGSDSRSDAQGNPLTQEEIDMLRAGDEKALNTDTIMVIRVPDDGSSATATSIPRDTYVKTPEFGNIKINGVYGEAKTARAEQMAAEGADQAEIEDQSTKAGRDALIRTVADLTGVTVDHYAEIGLLGFVLLTDAVGGVPVCLNAPVDDEFSGANFNAGVQTLDGADALSFVRQRHGLPRGDLDRITRQQAFMASFVNKLLSAGTLSSPSKLSELGDAVQRSVVLDDNWDVMGFATQMQDLTGGNVTFGTIPVTSIDGVGDYGESVVTVDKGQVHAYFDEMVGGGAGEESEDPDEGGDGGFTASDYTVSVYNASMTDGLAGRVSELLSGEGFGVGEVGNAEAVGVSMSQVNTPDTRDPAAKALAEKLGGLPVVYDPDLPEGSISVTLAGDYSGPGLEAAAEEVPADAGAEAAPAETDAATGEVVGQEGTGAPEDGPAIDAGGNGIVCVN
ncbi:LCP family protein [Corynebacterium sp. 335C]